jgi:predicted lipid-binding transport protein (Tim44 family)
MIVSAFAKGERKTLRPLLNDTVFDNFAAAIKAREDVKHSHETTLVGIKSVDILEAQMDGRTAFVTVKFVSEQINVTRDADGHVVDGDPSHVAEITDIWIFARNTRSADPNWTLVETRSPS